VPVMPLIRDGISFAAYVNQIGSVAKLIDAI
jgi:hypothetical protein